MLLSELRERFGDLEIRADGSFDLTGRVDRPILSNTLSYIIEKRYIKKISGNISCMITTGELAELVPKSMGIIISDDPKSLFWEIHNHIAKTESKVITPTVIGEGAVIHKSAVIAENNIVIGKNTVIKANAVIMEDVVIGDNCVIHPCVVIGDEGLQYQNIYGELTYIEHCGGVKIGNNVAIHACSDVAKALWSKDNTLIGDNVKIDAQVRIAHGAKIKRNSMLAGGASLGGQSDIGENCFLGINCSVKHSANISDNVKVGMGAVVLWDISGGETVLGNPARALPKSD